MKLNWSPITIACLLLGPACISSDGDAGDAEDGEFDAATGKADSPSEGSVDAKAILALVNDPSVRKKELDLTAALSSRVAEAIIAHRDGPDGYETSDDDPFDTLAELDAIPYLGPVAMDALLRYARTTATTATLTVDLVANEWTSGNGDQPVKLSDLNRQLAAVGLSPFPDKITIGGRDDAQFRALLRNVDLANEKLDRGLELQRTWDPNDYTGLCYEGPLDEIGPVVENLRGALFYSDMGIQAWRWKTTKHLFIDWVEGGETEWMRMQREELDNGDDVDIWKNFGTSTTNFLMMTDGGPQGDGTELFAVTIPPCS